MQSLSTTQKPLNQNQLDILACLYKFRFATPDLLTTYLKLPKNTNLRSRLEILKGHGYIGKKFEPSYRLLNKPASYHLLVKAFPVLRHYEDTSPKVLNNIRRDNHAAERFINHNLAVLSASNVLKTVYDQRLNFFTPSDLNTDQYSYFPQPLPDAFISLATSTHARANWKHFFLFIAGESLPFFVTMQKVLSYVDYASKNEWKKATGSALMPPILILCESRALQNRLHKRLAQLAEKNRHAPTFATTTQEDFGLMKPDDDAVWRPISQTRPLQPLGDIKATK